VSAAPEPVGTFQCSDDRLIAIHDAARLTFENCLQGIPIDTPLYEKQGYTGDAQLLSETYAYNYWMPNYLASWLEASVLPSQSEDGSMPGITPTPPENWIFDTPSPAWDAALFELPSTLLRHYGDRITLRRALPTLRRYLAYLEQEFPTGIVSVGLGDWNPPGYLGSPPEHPAIVSTAYYFRFLTLMAGFIREVGNSSEADRYSARARVVLDAFNTTFWNDRGFYTAPEDGDYRETNNLLPIAFGLAAAPHRELVLARIEDGVRSRGLHLDTGIVGTRFLLRVLSAAGRCDLAFDIARRENYPGWLHWINNGATTLYENWELDGRSHNHAMFGTIEEWFYADVAGISPGSHGWRELSINPHFPSDHRFACLASVETISGPVEAEWEKTGQTVRGRVVASSNARVMAPGGGQYSTVTHRIQHRDAFTNEHTFEFELR
jgi:alpha-L-rhamnosidase